jgi:hypothetical protein
MEESFDLHKRALLQYKKFTVGKNHHRTADVCIKVADHYVRLNQYDNARLVFAAWKLNEIKLHCCNIKYADAPHFQNTL